jgi:hypothetical protein
MFESRSHLLAKLAAATTVFALAAQGCALPASDGEAASGAELGARPRGTMPRLDPDQPAAGAIRSGSAPAGAHLNYLGGRVVSNVRVVQVIYGTGSYLPEVTSTATPSIATFYQQVTNSAYFDWLTEYNTSGGTHAGQAIGRGSFVQQVQITPSSGNNGTVISDASIQNELAAQITAGRVPAPTTDAAGNNNTYYAIFFPHGKTITLSGSNSCQAGGFCAYHGTIASVGGREVYYGVHPDMQSGSGCDVGCGGNTLFGNQQSVASHELVETVTDPEIGLTPVVAAPIAWYDTANGEIGDICNAQQGTVAGGDGQTYVVQKEFSNTANDCIVTRSAATHVPLYRYFNGRFHFYTASFAELGNGGGGYTLEGIVDYVSPSQVANTTPLYRYANTSNGSHFYTTDFNELGNGRNGLVLEGITGYMPTSGSGTTSFYRYVNPSTGDHFYTASFGELGNGSGGYQLEGVQSLIFTSP